MLLLLESFKDVVQICTLLNTTKNIPEGFQILIAILITALLGFSCIFWALGFIRDRKIISKNNKERKKKPHFLFFHLLFVWLECYTFWLLWNLSNSDCFLVEYVTFRIFLRRQKHFTGIALKSMLTENAKFLQRFVKSLWNGWSEKCQIQILVKAKWFRRSCKIIMVMVHAICSEKSWKTIDHEWWIRL